MSITQEIENAVDMVELVGRYTKLKKAGTNYKALCPFPGHNEKTPSFIVSPAKQIGYCFGCQKGGGPIKFIMDLENATFRESLEILSSITGINVGSFDEKTEKIRKNLFSLFKDASTYYNSTLNRYPKIEKYLADRNLTKEDISDFKIGFSDSGIELYSYLKEKGYDDEQIKQSNIFTDVKNKLEKFINRVIFPIQNQRGDIIAFAGRILGNSGAKYINSPASKIYDKSSILYGLYQGKNEIIKKDFIIITEGYMDTISLHKNGYKNTVCVSGTAFTEKHIKIIKRLTNKIFLCFDNDKAGINATKLAIETLKNNDLEIKVILLEGGKDPDEILSSGKNFDDFIKKALTPIGFFLKTEKPGFDKSSLDEKKKLLASLLNLLKSYDNNIEKDHYLKEISKNLDISLDIVYNAYNKTRIKSSNQNIRVKKRQYTSDETAIGYIINNPVLIEKFKEKLIFKDTLNSKLKKLLKGGINLLDTLTLEEKEEMNALSLYISIEGKQISEILIDKLITKINLDTYKREQSELKDNINDPKILKKYMDLQKKATEAGIKK